MAKHLARPRRSALGPDAVSTPRLRAQAVRWLAQREHSRSELQARLLAWAQAATAGSPEAEEDAPAAGHSALAAALPARVAEVMDQLAAEHWQSDARFVETRVNARQARWGTRRIAQELKQHGLGLPADAQDQLNRTELARAQAIWARRYGAAPADAADFARQSRFLLARGFAHDTVRRVVPRPGRASTDETGADELL